MIVAECKFKTYVTKSYTDVLGKKLPHCNDEYEFLEKRYIYIFSEGKKEKSVTNIRCLPNYRKYLSTQFVKPGRLYCRKIQIKLFFQALEQSFDLYKAEDNKFGVKSFEELKSKLENFAIPYSFLWLLDNSSINLIKLWKDKNICLPVYMSQLIAS